MSDRIPPALSAEEWASGNARDVGYLVPGKGPIVLRLADDEMRTKDLPALIAVANAALPDTDPRKFTRADVELLRKIDEYWLLSAEEYAQDRNAFRALAAKFAALLPPK